tara:strand:+ start:12999 stop:13286 length:288 start_codon:yes stop_codon:yes gene_type:complete
MALFALGGSTYGMAEESLAFYALLIPVMLTAGYDSVVVVGIILLRVGIGCHCDRCQCCRYSFYAKNVFTFIYFTKWLVSLRCLCDALCSKNQKES